MSLDLPTLLIVTVFVTALVGALLLFSWVQNRRVHALAWWGGALGLAAAATIMMSGRGEISDVVSIDLSNAAMLVAYGVFWTGMCRFEGRRSPWLLVLAGPLLWLVACRLPAFHDSVGARVVLASLISISYTLSAALEVWRGRREALMSRYPILAILLVHAALYTVRVPATLLAEGGAEHALYDRAWITGLSLELLLFIVVMAFLLLALTKERIEREQRLMANLDPLTGALNRRALFQDGTRLLARDRAAGRPAALLLIDLDHFKRVNDAFGHSVGDAVLRALCRLAADHLPASARFVRLGGEEFACLLPATTPALALAWAESIRAQFAEARVASQRPQLRVTMSIGIAASDEVGHDLEALLVAADVNLYRAKSGGRNRVEHGTAEAARKAA
jgi:diguanylate cyclase (GGDEF)-like protein